MSRDDMETEAAARLLETTNDDDIMDQQETRANDTPIENSVSGTIDDRSNTSASGADHAAVSATASGAGCDSGSRSKAPSTGGGGGGGKDSGTCY